MFPYKISFVDCDNSPAVRSEIETQLESLAETFDRITSCEVKIRIPHKHHAKKFFHVHIVANVPGTQIVVSHEPEQDDGHMEVNKAIHDAFVKFERQLHDFHKRRSALSS